MTLKKHKLYNLTELAGIVRLHSDSINLMLKQIFQSKLARSCGVYTFASMVNAAVPFLLTPILTRQLSPADYGIVAMFMVLTAFFTPFLGLNVQGAASVRYFDKEEKDFPLYVGNCLIILSFSTATVSLLVLLFSGPISMLSGFPRQWLWAPVALCGAQFITLTLMTLWQVREEPVKYAVFQNLQVVLNISLSIFLVVSLRRGWQGRVEGQVIAALVFAATALIIMKQNKMFRMEYNRERLRHALAFGLPLIPHALGGILLTQTDRFFITNMVGLSATGIYAVGYQVAAILNMFVTSFNAAYMPWLYGKLALNDENQKIRIVKLTYLYFIGVLLMGLGLALIAPWFLGFFAGKAFTGAWRYTVWIVLGFCFHGMYYMVANYIFYSGKTKMLPAVTFLTAGVNVFLNYFFIKANGPLGAAQASATSYCFCFVATWIVSAKVYRMPWGHPWRAKQAGQA